MPYPKTLSTSREAEIIPLLEKLTKLQPSESFSISGDADSLKRIRESLYIHLASQNLKPFYRIKQLSCSELHILRLVPSSFSFISPSQTILGATLQPIFEDCLLPLPEESMAETKISSLLKEGKISPKDAIELISAWRKVND